MRYILFVLFFFMATGSFAQVELLGRYTANFSMGSESIKFVGKDSFYFEAFYCGEIVRGKGRCEIRDNFLYLFFEKDSQEENAKRKPVIEISDNKDGEFVLHISCVDINSKPIAQATVRIRKGNGATTTIYCDNDGKAVYKTNGVLLPLQIETTAVGYKIEKMQIDSAADYNIVIRHEDTFEEVKGKDWAYEIDELSEDVIVMKRAKTAGEYRRFTKK